MHNGNATPGFSSEEGDLRIQSCACCSFEFEFEFIRKQPPTMELKTTRQNRKHKERTRRDKGREKNNNNRVTLGSVNDIFFGALLPIRILGKVLKQIVTVARQCHTVGQLYKQLNNSRGSDNCSGCTHEYYMSVCAWLSLFVSLCLSLSLCLSPSPFPAAAVCVRR